MNPGCFSMTDLKGQQEPCALGKLPNMVLEAVSGLELLISLPYIARSRVPRQFAIISTRNSTQKLVKYVGSVFVPLE